VKRRRRTGAAPRRGRDRSPAAPWSGGRVIPLTEARRRLAERRRAAAKRRVRPAGSGARRGAGPRRLPETGAIDFHLAAAVSCARAAGRVLLDHWGRRATLSVQRKGPNDFVTAADRAAEDAVIRILRSRFPDHAIVAEESASDSGAVGRDAGGPRDAGSLRDAAGRDAAPGYRWFIDPLDGTTNYIHGIPTFGVSIGLMDAQGMRAAAVFDPVRDEMFTAARGAGAFLNGEPIRATRPGKLANALLVTGIPFRSLDRLENYLASFKAFIRGSAGIRRDGSAALDLAYVACGRYDGFWEMGLSSWDVAAGSLLVTEAGGVVTDFHGRGDYVASGDIVAAGPEIHAPMLSIVRDAWRR
jgi:myo-inositol-1(or 4)-monophosphatase